MRLCLQFRVSGQPKLLINRGPWRRGGRVGGAERGRGRGASVRGVGGSWLQRSWTRGRRGPLGSFRTQSFRQRRPGVRAVVIREFGPPEVLEPADVAEVRAGPDEVVIDVEVANITFVETQVRAGRPPHPSMLPALPAILGNGVGGMVGEGSPWAGRRVVAGLNGTGGYAEQAVSAV